MRKYYKVTVKTATAPVVETTVIPEVEVQSTPINVSKLIVGASSKILDTGINGIALPVSKMALNVGFSIIKSAVKATVKSGAIIVNATTDCINESKAMVSEDEDIQKAGKSIMGWFNKTSKNVVKTVKKFQ